MKGSLIMESIKVSLVMTVKNEKSTIDSFLKSILTQKRVPDEIIIVDGGSKDGTVEAIKSFLNDLPIKLFIVENANIARGRNIAIKNSKYEYIACTDAGCKLDKDWLKNIIKYFENDASIDVVSGFYLPDTHTLFEECVAEVTYRKLNTIKNDNFLPSSRSIAFKKKVWEEVGGYPEWLYTAEDTLYDINLKKRGFKFVFAKDAIVYWRPRGSLKKLIKQMYLYGKGDGEAKLFIRTFMFKSFILLLTLCLMKISILYCLCFVFLIVLTSSLPHLINSDYINNPTSNLYKLLILIPMLICCVQISNLIGFYVGLLRTPNLKMACSKDYRMH